MPTFDSSLPATNSKIKNYPTILTENFGGIEQGDLSFQVWQSNLVDRTTILPAPPPATPAVIPDNMILYSDDDAGDSELYCIDPAGNIVQITQNGSLGSATTNILGLSSGFATAWAVFPASATNGIIAPTYGYNIAGRSRTNPNAGIYDITTNAVFNTSQVTVMCMPFTGSSGPISMDILVAPTILANVVTISVDMRNRNGNHDDVAFHIIVFGGI